MTVKVRSVAGNINTSDPTTHTFDSPATITAGDLLTLMFVLDDNDAQSITPDTGWTLEAQDSTAGSLRNGARTMLFTKTAVAGDVTNAGTADYYSFTGVSADSAIYAVFSLYDDAGGTVQYVSGSLDGVLETNGGTSSSTPGGTTVSTNGSMMLSHWLAQNNTDWFDMDSGESYSPTGGANATLHHDTVTANGFSNNNMAYGTAEFDIVDSPVGAQILSHTALDNPTDEWCTKMLFEPVSTGIVPQAMYHYQNGSFY